MWLVKVALGNRYAVIVLALAIVVLGLVAAWRIPVDILPIFRAPAVQVMTFYSGMPAGVAEKNITNRLERWTGQANGTVRQESKSMVGVSIIRNYFSDDTDPNSALTQVNSLALSNLRYLPPGTLPPIVLPFDPTATMPICILSVSSGELGEGELQDIARYELRNAVQSVSGAVAPAVFGGKVRAVLAYVDRGKLEARGMSPVDVVKAISDYNIMLPTGGARIGDIDYQIDSNSMLASPADMDFIPLKAEPGNAVFLRDVGHAQDANRIQTGLVRINGRRQVYVPVYRQQGASTLSVVEGVKAAIPAMKERIPSGIDLRVVMDQSIYVREAIKSLMHEGVFGAVLAAGMILVFLGSFRSTTIATLSIPLSILAAIAGLLATGNTINAMTLGGLALAVGPLVDNAIVVLENTHRHLALGKSAESAAGDATNEVALPVLVATCTTIIVLLPIAFTAGMGKFLFRPLALSVTFAMLASYVLSMTFVPSRCAIWLRAHPNLDVAHRDGQKRRGLHHRFERLLGRLVAVYERVLRAALRRRTGVLSSVGALFVGSGTLFLFLGQELFPQVDAGQIVITMRVPTGTRLEKTEENVIEVENVLREQVATQDLSMIISELGVVPDWSSAYTPNSGPQDAVLKVQLSDDRKKTAQQYAELLRGELARRFPGVEFAFNTGGIVSAALNYGSLSPIDVQIAGKANEKSRQLARDIWRVVRQVSGAADVRINQRFDYPQLYLEVDRSRAADLGLTQEDIIQNVVSSLNSSIQFARNFWIDPVSGNQYWVGVQYDENAVESVDTLLNIPITSPRSSGPVLLRNVARVRRDSAPAEITHADFSPVTDIYANVAGRDVASVARDIERALAQLELPEGVRVRMSGEVQRMRTAFGSMGFGLAMATVLVYLIMVALFRSYLDPLIILFTVPLGLIGVLVMLFVTGTTLNVQSGMGIIFMVGIVVANSVLLVDFANRLLAQGMTVAEAVTTAAGIRLRPILMTFLATFLDLLPMAIGMGKGSEANVPLARAVVGGLLAGTCMTLIVVPILYTLMRRQVPASSPLDDRIATGAVRSETDPDSHMQKTERAPV
jgi:multidrug efflux pump subunit AcrB